MSKEHLRNLAGGEGKHQPQNPEKQLPGRINVIQTANLLGFQQNDIAILIRRKMLVPLGKPKPNAPKYFGKVYVLALANDLNWLGEATQIIYDHWKQKNDRKGGNDSGPDEEPQAAFAA